MSDLSPERVRELFEGARKLAGEARSAFLDAECAGDARLRREVSELLDHLNDLPTSFSDEVPTSAHPLGAHHEVDQLPPGTVIANFTIERTLGVGGMGAVYLAHQQRPQRAVALKLIRHGWGGQRALLRFSRETELLGRLQHPGIAQIYDAGMAQTSHGAQPYFAMEYVKGRTLLAHVESASLDTRARLQLMARICEAVDHAHRAGIVHRDLKPANILVTDEGHPKILDFGVARATDADLQITTIQTDIGQLIGTVPYMSPEQAGGASGDGDSIDARSDVYALGVIAYQLLTGRLPYNLSGKMVHEAVRIIHDDDPTPLSSIDRSLRGDIETIVAKSLEKERHRRYQSAADLAADIERYLADQPITARPPSAVYQLAKFSRRNKGLVAGIAATFLVLIAGVIVSTVFGVGQARERRLAETRLEESEAVMSFLTEAFASPRAESAGFDVTAQQVIDAAAGLVDERFSDQPVARARAKYTIAATYRALSRNKEALPLLEAALKTQTDTLGPEDSSTLDTALELAEVYRLLGRRDDSLALYEQTVPTIERRFGVDSHNAIQARLNLANLYDDDPSRIDLAVQIYTESIDQLEQDPDAHPSSLISSIQSLAIIRAQQERYDEADALYARTYEIVQEHFPGDTHEHALVLTNRGNLRRHQDRLPEAEADLRTALGVSERRQGPDHEGTVIARSSLARILLAQEKYDEALPELRACAEGMRRIYGDDHPRALIAENDIGNTLRRTGHVDEALAMSVSIVERSRAALPPGHWFIGAFLFDYGTSLNAAERYEEATVAYLEAYELHLTQFGPDHSRTRSIVKRIVENYEAAGESENADLWRAKLTLPESSQAADPAS